MGPRTLLALAAVASTACTTPGTRPEVTLRGECEVDTGRRLGADLVVSGELVRIGTRLKLDLRLHDTRNGQLLSGVTAQGKSIDDLDDDLARAVKALISW